MPGVPPHLNDHFADVLALGHVAEGVLHLGLGEHGALEGLHHAVPDARTQQRCHLPPAGAGLVEQRVQQDPVEGHVLQEDGHACGGAGRRAQRACPTPRPARALPSRRPRLTQRVVVGKVKFADFQEAAVLGQAPHTGLQLLLRQGVQHQVHAWQGEERALVVPATARPASTSPEGRTLSWAGLGLLQPGQ